MEGIFLLLALVSPIVALALLFAISSRLDQIRVEAVLQRRILNRMATQMGAGPDPFDQELIRLMRDGKRDLAYDRVVATLNLPKADANHYLQVLEDEAGLKQQPPVDQP